MVIIIPAYEPEITFEGFVKQLKARFAFPILIVNDGSSKEKEPVFEALRPYAQILTHAQNEGKGAAMKTAVRYVNEHMPEEDSVIFADADGQHSAHDIEKVAEALRAHEDSLILGVREFSSEVPVKSRFGNKLTRAVFRFVSGVRLSDTQTGLRAFSRRFFERALQISGKRYEYEMNMLLCFAREGVPFFEVPIRTLYIDEKNSTSHFNAFWDSLRIYGVIFQFAGASLFSAAADYLLFLLFTALFTKLSLPFEAVAGANILARICSAGLNYTINKKYVFQSTAKQSLVRYILLAAVILTLNTGILLLLTKHLLIKAALAKPLAEILLFIFSFLMQNRFVFQDKDNSQSKH